MSVQMSNALADIYDSQSDLVSRALARLEADKRAIKDDPAELIRRGWIFTLDPHPPAGTPAIRPLPLLPHIEAVCKLYTQYDSGMIFKSRQVQMSWVFALLTLWQAMYNDGSHCIIQGKRLEDVDAKTDHRMLGRVRFIRKRLPPFMQPGIVKEDLAVESFHNGSAVEAVPEGGDIIRSRVPSMMFMDELAFQDNGESSWNAARASARRLWGVSTPNGHDFMYKEADPGRPWDDWRLWPEIADGVHSYVNRHGICLIFVHESADPAKKDLKWQEQDRKGYTDQRKYLREKQGNFTLYDGMGVYSSEFSPNIHQIPSYVPDPNLPLYRGWDFGYTGQAVSFAQMNLQGQMIWFDQIIVKGVSLERVIQEVLARTSFWMGRAEMTVGMDSLVKVARPQVYDYGDPAAKAHNSRGETDLALLSQYGIRLGVKRTMGRKMDIVGNVRTLLLPRSDGKPGLLLAKNSPEMDHVAAGFAGAYRYGQTRDGKAEKEIPHKDGYYDHMFDSFQYLVDNVRPIQYGITDDVTDGYWPSAEPGVGTDAYLRSN